MQGEGQEFESPRLHHSSEPSSDHRRIPDCARSHHPSTEELGSSPEVTLGSQMLSEVDGSKAGPRAVFSCLAPDRAPDPCPPRRGHRPADRWDGGRRARRRDRPPGRPHLTNWIRFGNRRTSISPSYKDHPDPPWRLTVPGQVLEGVKLQRARGGCLGAKSR